MLMTEVKIEKPSQLTNRNLCYWAEKEGVLIGGQKQKAMNFIKNGLVQKTEYGWVVLPIDGYNSTPHKIVNNECSCQWFQKGNGECSHLLAVRLLNFKEKWNA